MCVIMQAQKDCRPVYHCNRAVASYITTESQL